MDIPQRTPTEAHDILSREPGWQVCGEASTGREALAMAESLLPDLLILDIGLPELNGLEVARRAYILDNGRFVLQGSAADIRNDPDLKRAYLGM